MKEITTRASMLIMIMDLIGESAEEVAAETGKQCMDCLVLSKLAHKLQKALFVDTEEIAETERARYGLVSKS